MNIKSIIQNFFIYPLALMIFAACQFTSEEKKDVEKEELSLGVEGVQKKYRKDKTLLSTMEYKDRKRHGISRSFYEDGKTIHLEIRYDMGVKNGITNSYYTNGRLYYSVNYVDGKREGMMKKYYETGELMAEIPYKNSIVQEGLVEYQKSGKKKTIYPEIVFEEIDKTAFENSYIVRLKLSDNKKNVKFYRILFDKSGNEIAENLIMPYDGVVEVKFDLQKNYEINVRFKIKAVVTTFLNNPYVIYKEKQIKAAW